jgi:hypothetical protein
MDMEEVHDHNFDTDLEIIDPLTEDDNDANNKSNSSISVPEDDDSLVNRMWLCLHCPSGRIASHHSRRGHTVVVPPLPEQPDSKPPQPSGSHCSSPAQWVRYHRRRPLWYNKHRQRRRLQQKLTAEAPALHVYSLPLQSQITKDASVEHNNEFDI